MGLPVVIAGGPLSGYSDETVDAVRQTIDAGARGVIVGRNIWQPEEADALATLEKIAKLTRGVTDPNRGEPERIRASGP